MTYIETEFETNDKKWRFGVVGNIVRSHPGEDGKTYYGTKAFKGGTKVYLEAISCPSHGSDIPVIGMNRFGRYVLEDVPAELIENIRFQVVHKRTVLEIMDYLDFCDGQKWCGRTAEDKRRAQTFAKNWYLEKI